LIDLTGTNLLLCDEIALHWGFTCANDVIEGAYSVPESGMPGLIVIGLLGMILPGHYATSNNYITYSAKLNAKARRIAGFLCIINSYLIVLSLDSCYKFFGIRAFNAINIISCDNDIICT
jgi:hypothetical protein